MCILTEFNPYKVPHLLFYGVPSISMPLSCYNKLCQNFDKVKLARIKCSNILSAIKRKLGSLHFQAGGREFGLLKSLYIS